MGAVTAWAGQGHPHMREARNGVVPGLSGACGPVALDALVAGAGFEPATSGL